MAKPQCLELSLFLVAILLCLAYSESQPCQAGNISCLVLNQSSWLGVSEIIAVKQAISIDSQPGTPAPVNGTAIATELATQLAANLGEVANAVRNLTSQAGLEYSSHTSQNCCSSECIPQDETRFTISACSEHCPGVNDSNQLKFYRATVPYSVGAAQVGVFQSLDFELNQDLGRRVNLSHTALHYPVDIFDRDSRVLCFAQWSENLTQYFIESSISPVTASVQFQFFGAASGALRFYPASEWSSLNRCHRCPLELVDAYDSRFRPWYINTVSGTKFLVIVLDLSGSMTGFRLLLAKLTAKQLLLSLSHNDYFHVLTVGGGSEGGVALRNCFNTSRRASPENILTVVEVIDGISESRDVTDSYKDVVNQARDSFSDPTVPESCHKLLVFLSDRDILISDLARVLRSYGRGIINNATVVIVMNGYPRVILREDISSLRDITRQTGGFIQEIESYNTINTFLLRLLENLRSQFMSSTSNNDDSEVFWNHYKDFTAGIVLTCSQPLYKDRGISNQSGRTFVGVGGIDVNRTLLEQSFQQYDLGPYGYGFIVDNNGQLLVHPLINNTYVKAISGDDLLTLDISNFEQSGAIEDVRAAILNRTAGSMVVDAWVAVGGQRSEFRLMSVTYHYAPIAETPFSVVIVIPESHTVTSISSPLSSDQLESLNSILNTFSQTYSINLLRPVCNISEFSASFDSVAFLQQLISQQMMGSFMDDGTDNCEQNSVNGILLDLWTAVNETMEDSLPASGQRVLEFPSGLVVSGRGVNCQAPPISLATRSAVLDFALQMNSSDSVFYDATPCGVSWFTVVDENSTQPLNPSSSAVYGEVNPPLPLLTSSSTSSYSTLLVQGQGRGLILNSSISEEIGRYFADVYPHVFNAAFMHLESAYNMSVLRGFEVRPCSDIFRSTTVCMGSSAHSISKGVVLSVVNAMWWVWSGGPLLSLHLLLTSLYASLMSGLSSAQSEACPVTLCDHQVATFQWPRPPFSREGTAFCNMSMTDYSIAAIPATNLFLVEIMDNIMCSDTPFLDNISRLSPVAHCPCDVTSDRYRVSPPTVTAGTGCQNRNITGSQSSDAVHVALSKYVISVSLILSIFTSYLSIQEL